MPQKIALLLMRISIGWLFLYAGISKLFDPAWSAAGYIKGAQSGTWLYSLFLGPSMLPIVNGLVKYGLTLIGIALILGIFVRLSSLFGSILMLLLYFPILTFPYVGKNAFLVDDHIIYILVLGVLATFQAGRYWGLETWCSNLSLCKRYPNLRAWLG